MLQAIQLTRRSAASGEYDCIRIVIGGLFAHCDLMSGRGGDQQLRQAAVIAGTFGIEIQALTPDLANRLKAAISDREEKIAESVEHQRSLWDDVLTAAK